MLSHLRFHRRDKSTPTSPLPEQLSPWDHAEHPLSVQDIASRPDFLPRISTTTNTPPVLPPVHRVSSPDDDSTSATLSALSPLSIRGGQQQHNRASGTSAIAASATARKDNGTTGGSNAGSGGVGGESGFIGGVALRKYEQEYRISRPVSAGYQGFSTGDSDDSPGSSLSPPSGGPDRGTNAYLSGSRNADVLRNSGLIPQIQQQNGSSPSGKRPPGTRLQSEPVPSLYAAQSNSNSSGNEAQRTKKGLPFLKNPMSTLLLRRRAGQNAPDLEPIPVETTIRGTRIHDFSAPRLAPSRTAVPKQVVPISVQESAKSSSLKPPVQVAGSHERSISTWSATTGDESLQTQDVDEGDDVSVSTVSEGEFQRWRELGTSPKDGKQQAFAVKDASGEQNISKHKDSASVSTSKHAEPAATSEEPSPGLHPTASKRSQASTRKSTADDSTRDSFALALPRHMKSTSSRFSFDMAGAARAEKLLEERHRQRELEKLTSEPEEERGPRDSRYDDIDEDAMYDAMMDGDDDEEAIPEINDDYDEEDVPLTSMDTETEEEEEEQILDEDEERGAHAVENDQDNFAGFVFSRSDPQSRLASPVSITQTAYLTPRDADGHPIGFALTRNDTPDILVDEQTIVGDDEEQHEPGAERYSAGLGISGVDISANKPYDPTVFQERRGLMHDRKIAMEHEDDDHGVYDEGLAQELQSEYATGLDNFDETIFDDNDTDQYGRPIPGAFAQAQAQRNGQPQRESGITSRISGQSAGSTSTAHTSLSTGLLHRSPTVETGSRAPDVLTTEAVISQDELSPADKIAAYQAALAEAARHAAASGKFRRNSSPPPPPLPPTTAPAAVATADLSVTSPTTGLQPSTGGHQLDPTLENLDNDDNDDNLNDYETGGIEDDFDFDDEVLIAEANANALAFDADGFYGQEFGFYSAPEQGRTNAAARNNPNGKPNTFEYASGGYFGPSGVITRTKSGKVVSREPNLTPITERSEYSNRNSIMSLGLPPGAFSADGRNSAPLHSPGLAQLAMMADDGDMSLHALMRLRSKAFGGSQNSLLSSRDGSPRAERPLTGDGSSPATGSLGTSGTTLQPAHTIIAGVGGKHGRKNSNFSTWSSSDLGSTGGSPTLTLTTTTTTTTALPVSGGNKPLPVAMLFSTPIAAGTTPTPQCPPVLETEEVLQSPEELSSSPASANRHAFAQNQQFQTTMTSFSNTASPTSPFKYPPVPFNSTPTSPDNLQRPHSSSSSSLPLQHQISRSKHQSTRPVIKHRHTSSGDSISYMMEQEHDTGETRWVMERRRTADTGEVEILGREVVPGGRI